MYVLVLHVFYFFLFCFDFVLIAPSLQEDRFFMTPAEVTEIEAPTAGTTVSFNINSPKTLSSPRDK